MPCHTHERVTSRKTPGADWVRDSLWLKQPTSQDVTNPWRGSWSREMQAASGSSGWGGSFPAKSLEEAPIPHKEMNSGWVWKWILPLFKLRRECSPEAAPWLRTRDHDRWHSYLHRLLTHKNLEIINEHHFKLLSLVTCYAIRKPIYKEKQVCFKKALIRDIREMNAWGLPGSPSLGVRLNRRHGFISAWGTGIPCQWQLNPCSVTEPTCSWRPWA